MKRRQKADEAVHHLSGRQAHQNKWIKIIHPGRNGGEQRKRFREEERWRKPNGRETGKVGAKIERRRQKGGEETRGKLPLSKRR